MKKNKKIPLVTLRLSKGLSQKELANVLNVSQSTIGMYELGKRKPSLEKAIIISNYFNVSVENISFGTEKQ